MTHPKGMSEEEVKKILARIHSTPITFEGEEGLTTAEKAAVEKRTDQLFSDFLLKCGETMKEIVKEIVEEARE